MISAACAFGLAAALAFAGVAKARDRGSARQAAVALGVPAAIAGAVVVALPLVELAVAAGLVAEPTRRISAAVAAALLGVFTLVVAGNLLVRKSRPACNCFGASSTRPIGAGTLGRNAVLIVVALLAGGWIMSPPLSEWGSLTLLWLLCGIEALALAVLGWLVAELTRQQGRMLAQLRALNVLAHPGEAPSQTFEVGLAAGTSSNTPVLTPGIPLPAVMVQSAKGPPRAVRELLHGDRPTALLFLSDHCGPCRSIMDNHIVRWLSDAASRVAVLPLLDGHPSVGSRPFSWLDPLDLAQLGLRGVPAAVLVEPGGIILAEPEYGEDAIVSIVDSIPPPV